jgi:predicted RNA-binding protein with PUA-like domain
VKYWLMKTEPDEFSIGDLERKRVEPWNGVRSMFARFHMRAMTVGDEVLFYHSSCVPPGVAGLARVARTGVIDETQFDPQSKYYDEKSSREKPKWDCVDVEYVSTLPNLVTLERIRADKALAEMVLLRQGRLSVQPVSEAEYRHIVELAQTTWEPPPKPPKKKKAKPNGNRRGKGTPRGGKARGTSRRGKATGRRTPK